MSAAGRRAAGAAPVSWAGRGGRGWRGGVCLESELGGVVAGVGCVWARSEWAKVGGGGVGMGGWGTVGAVCCSDLMSFLDVLRDMEGGFACGTDVERFNIGDRCW